MEFNQKLQELRKEKGLTQEQLGEVLFVSRTAISKWESGRGYPNIESLKQIAKFFGVSLDELLSCNELLTVAEKENKRKENHVRNLVFGLLDISFLTLFFLPFFRQNAGDTIYGVSLINLISIAPYLKVLYCVITSVSMAIGLLTLILMGFNNRFWTKNGHKISLTVNALGVILFSCSLQPYASVLSFLFFLIKAVILKKV